MNNPPGKRRRPGWEGASRAALPPEAATGVITPGGLAQGEIRSLGRGLGHWLGAVRGPTKMKRLEGKQSSKISKAGAFPSVGIFAPAPCGSRHLVCSGLGGKMQSVLWVCVRLPVEQVNISALIRLAFPQKKGEVFQRCVDAMLRDMV